MLGTIWQLLLRALWLLMDGKSQDDPCPRHHPKKHSRMNAGSRSHGAITSLQWQWHCRLTHTPLVGGGIGGDRTGRGKVSQQSGILQDPAPQQKQV